MPLIANGLLWNDKSYVVRAPRVLFVRALTLAVWNEFVWRGLQHGDPRWWKLVKMHHFSLKRRWIRAKKALWLENLLHFSFRQEFDAMCKLLSRLKLKLFQGEVMKWAAWNFQLNSVNSHSFIRSRIKNTLCLKKAKSQVIQMILLRCQKHGDHGAGGNERDW